MLIIHLIFSLTLLLLACQDLKTKTINGYYLIPVYFSYILLNLKTFWLASFCYGLWLIFHYFLANTWIGAGDIDILFCGFCLTSPINWLIWLNMACYLQILIHYLQHRHGPTPFVPSLTLSWFGLFFLA
ncbi:Flp pilus assembly protein protease CpaA [Weissella uvarum]|uniref:hypothetical protein n=1 Tax=Weissella uvarum TaxID=1479233 RepID=UPI0019620460|nr:hypothetical protein [Weissella uvarum]MBM7617983.1 Flp pilus assembly protein protease CpaA [Weissella uvarum]MCM0596202.1 hypothetical protein [Weissella uvarum]